MLVFRKILSTYQIGDLFTSLQLKVIQCLLFDDKSFLE